MHAVQFGQGEQQKTDPQGNLESPWLSLERHEQERQIENHLAKKIERGQERMPGVQQPGSGKRQGQQGRLPG
jgi:hypothetical protein